MSIGYTLPVFACASAIAALRHLQGHLPSQGVTVDLIEPPQLAEIAIEQVAKIDTDSAIAITRSDPGDHLDLTRHTPVWAKVSFTTAAERIKIEGGEGIGKQQGDSERAAIYSYARKLLQTNLQPLLGDRESISVTIILPEGVRLAKRTSNEAFGVVQGLSLLGTTGIVQPLTAPSQLEAYQEQIKAKAASFNCLVFCIGENGIDLAQKMGIDPQRIVKTANWLGSMLVTAAAAEVSSILLFGYHGKLIKLAGGIFHTHNHLADGRLEILTAYCAQLNLPPTILRQIFNSPTAESALSLLRELDAVEEGKTDWVNSIYALLAEAIDSKSQAYVSKYTERRLRVGSVLFDRQRRVIHQSNNALLLLSELC